jgi:predicted transcriptional regulator
MGSGDMNVREFQDTLDLSVVAGEKGLDREVRGGYCGDLLSDVMANSPIGCIWMTIQSHKNIMAVAVLKEMAAIILVNGHQPDDETKAKADEEGIPILLTPLSAYQIAGMLFQAGVGREGNETI